MPSPGGSRGRTLGFYALLVVATLLLVVSAFAVWVNRVALNTDVFTDSSTALIEDEEIRTAVATRAVDELFDSVDVEAEVVERLPDDFDGLGAPLTAGLHQAGYTLVSRALERPAAQRIWSNTIERAHGQLVDVLEGREGTVSIEGGAVTLDLRDLVLEAADQIGIRSQAEESLPAVVGEVEILRSDELDTAQDAAQILQAIAWLLPLLTLGVFVLAAWLAHDRRRAVRAIGIAVLVAGAVGYVAVDLAGGYLVDSLVAESQNRAAAGNAWDIVSELLRSTFVRFIVVGALFVLAAWLIGPSRRAVSTRRALAPIFHERAWVYAIFGVVALVLLLASSASDLTRVLFLLTGIGLLGMWMELMRRQTLREFPDVEGGMAFVDDTWDRLKGWSAERAKRARREAPTPPTPPPASIPPVPSAAPATDLASRLTMLAELHAQGHLTDEEYASAKARVLAGE